MKRVNVLPLLIVSFVMTACKSYEERFAEKFDQRLTNYIADCSTNPKECNFGEKPLTAFNINYKNFITGLPTSSGYRDENGDIVGVVGRSEIMKNDTLRDKDWIVIWDANNHAYKAVDVGYLRQIEISERQRVHGTSEEFYEKYIGEDEYGNSDYSTYYNSPVIISRTGEIFIGDDTPTADTWEYVTYDRENNIFTGTTTGFKYEDEEATYDVSLMTAEKEETERYQRVGNLSAHFQMSVQTSMALVQLSDFAMRASKQNGGFTKNDQLAFESGLSSIAGVTAGDVIKAIATGSDETEIVEKIAKKIGTSSANLKDRILPELFGIEL